MSFEFDGRVWRMSSPVVDNEGNESLEWNIVPITEVPQKELLETYEDLVLQLTSMEVELYKLKEQYLLREAEIINEVDFKAIYGKNNEKVRNQHCKEVLSDMVQSKVELQFSIEFIRNYLPLLREVLHQQS